MCRTVVVERDISSSRKAAVMNSGKLLQAKTVIEFQKIRYMLLRIRKHILHF